MKTSFISILLTLVLIFSFAGCNQENQGQATPADTVTVEDKEPVTPEDLALCKNITTGHNDFGFKLYSELLKEEGEKNIFLSPSSIALALSMTYNGADGKTKDAMAETLGIKDMTLEDLNKISNILIRALPGTDPKVELAIANALFCNPTITFKEDFTERCRKSYFAKISNDFNKDVINGWVKENTKGKIEKIIDEVPGDAILYLINAIYFKGKWALEFDKNATQEKDFYLSDGSKKTHPLMNQSGEYSYYKGEKFQAVSLPYGEGKFSMYIFLPDENSTLSEFHKGLTSENWEKWIKSFSSMEGTILLPRFKMEYEILLNDTLCALGMENAFSGAADFSGMCSGGVFISKVLHKTFVEVNEEGTEAAAVTSVEMGKGLSAPPERFYMEVNRPFFFAIRDNETGTVLFMGSIVNPEE